MRLLQSAFLGLAASLVAYGAMPATPVLAAENVITIGAAVSFTGRYAVNGKHTSVVEILISAAADVNAKVLKDWTVLHSAAAKSVSTTRSP